MNLSKKNNVIVLEDYSSVSPLGSGRDEIRQNYLNSRSLIGSVDFAGTVYPAAKISADSEKKLAALVEGEPLYSRLDRAVQLALQAAEGLRSKISPNKRLFINIGSSRGATSCFEEAHRSFVERASTPVLTSPTTTLGNLSSWVMRHLSAEGSILSSSVTCSTALQSVTNAAAWLLSGMAETAVAGASEAPLTPFTISQMKALRIYSAGGERLEYPATPCAADYPAESGMVLGEGAALFLLSPRERGDLARGDLYIQSAGWASERITNHTSISENGAAIFEAMRMAVSDIAPQDFPQVILLHAPGNKQGDLAELSAVRRLLHGRPSATALVSNKWMIGHTLGAAGAFNLEYAAEILRNQLYADFPYETEFKNPPLERISSVMINSAGFGGNATSIILKLAD